MLSRVFVLFLSVNLSCAMYSAQVQLPESGLHYEYVKSLRFTPVDWKLVTYIDLEKFLSQRPIVTAEILENITHICSFYAPDDICTSTIRPSTLLEKAETVEKFIKQFRHFMQDPTIEDGKQVPAGFLSIIKETFFGEIAFNETLLDNEKIRKLTSDENKPDTLLVQSGLHSLHYHLDLLREVTRKSGEVMDAFISTNSTNFYGTVVHISALARNLERELDVYSESLQSIIDAIYLAKAGILHPKLLTLDKLETAVKNFSSSTYMFPIDIQDLDSDKLIKISKLNIGYAHGKLVVVLTVPLLGHNVFKVYKMYPLPTTQVLGHTQVSAYIQPRAEYLLLTQNYYTLARAEDLGQCVSTDGTYICQLRTPIYNLSSEPICEAAIITENVKTDPYADCNIKIRSTAKPYWMRTSNGWIYSIPNQEKINLICNDQWVNNINISKSGLIQLASGCRAVTSSTIAEGDSQSIINKSIIIPQLEKLDISTLLPTVKYVTYIPNYYIDLNYYLNQIQIYKYQEKMRWASRLPTLNIIINVIFLMILLVIGQYVTRKYYIVRFREVTV